MLKDLPYPYTSAAQYEASFTAPVGADWNAIATHQRATMPRVTKKVSCPFSSSFGTFLTLCSCPTARSYHRSGCSKVLDVVLHCISIVLAFILGRLSVQPCALHVNRRTCSFYFVKPSALSFASTLESTSLSTKPLKPPVPSPSTLLSTYFPTQSTSMLTVSPTSFLVNVNFSCECAINMIPNSDSSGDAESGETCVKVSEAPSTVT